MSDRDPDLDILTGARWRPDGFIPGEWLGGGSARRDGSNNKAPSIASLFLSLIVTIVLATVVLSLKLGWTLFMAVIGGSRRG